MNPRKKAKDLGNIGEAIACFYLLLKGYRIHAHQLRIHYHEIDILASQGNILVFVEVKTRRKPSHLPESITPEKKARLKLAVEHCLGRYPFLKKHAHSIRIDALLLSPWRWPSHKKGSS